METAMKHRHLIIYILLLTVLLCACGAKPDNDALSAYEEILKAAPAIDGDEEALMDASFGYEENLKTFGEHYDCFAVTDINGDSVPELIASSEVNFRWAPISVFTFSDGKAVLLKDPSDLSAHGTFEQNASANGAFLTYICEDGHIHSVWQGTDPAGEAVEENHAFALDAAALTEVQCSKESAVSFSDIAVANTPGNADSLK